MMTVSPQRLRADNFTPPSRTPWGGTRILSRYKAGLGLPATGIVGESWEVSVEPSFPSRSVDGRLLAELIGAEPLGWLGARAVERYGPETALLVKLLDAADHLSVQVHPSFGDAALAADESGKPEAWVVLAADPGAGLYLGFQDGVAEREVEACIGGGGALDQLMNFVPVAPGDAFVIDAGTPHAVGCGVTLLEPQIVCPGKRGLTYRYWDWNRRYDASGRLDASGAPRELHLARSLAVTDWPRGTGAGFIASCRAQGHALGDSSLRRVVIDWRWLEVEEWRGTGSFIYDGPGALEALVCVAGEVTITTELGTLRLACGESGVVPAATRALEVSAHGAHVFAVRAR
ncbi:MAG: hypothetical protein EXR75_04115 [Myxococcales bacterium]|nr:hypothetical protein [Myxococcales bacterium]